MAPAAWLEAGARRAWRRAEDEIARARRARRTRRALAAGVEAATARPWAFSSSGPEGAAAKAAELDDDDDHHDNDDREPLRRECVVLRRQEDRLVVTDGTYEAVAVIDTAARIKKAGPGGVQEGDLLVVEAWNLGFDDITAGLPLANRGRGFTLKQDLALTFYIRIIAATVAERRTSPLGEKNWPDALAFLAKTSAEELGLLKGELCDLLQMLAVDPASEPAHWRPESLANLPEGVSCNAGTEMVGSSQGLALPSPSQSVGSKASSVWMAGHWGIAAALRKSTPPSIAKLPVHSDKDSDNDDASSTSSLSSSTASSRSVEETRKGDQSKGRGGTTQDSSREDRVKQTNLENRHKNDHQPILQDRKHAGSTPPMRGGNRENTDQARIRETADREPERRGSSSATSGRSPRSERSTRGVSQATDVATATLGTPDVAPDAPVFGLFDSLTATDYSSGRVGQKHLWQLECAWDRKGWMWGQTGPPSGLGLGPRVPFEAYSADFSEDAKTTLWTIKIQLCGSQMWTAEARLNFSPRASGHVEDFEFRGSNFYISGRWNSRENILRGKLVTSTDPSPVLSEAVTTPWALTHPRASQASQTTPRSMAGKSRSFLTEQACSDSKQPEANSQGSRKVGSTAETRVSPAEAKTQERDRAAVSPASLLSEHESESESNGAPRSPSMKSRRHKNTTARRRPRHHSSTMAKSTTGRSPQIFSAASQATPEDRRPATSRASTGGKSRVSSGTPGVVVLVDSGDEEDESEASDSAKTARTASAPSARRSSMRWLPEALGLTTSAQIRAEDRRHGKSAAPRARPQTSKRRKKE